MSDKDKDSQVRDAAVLQAERHVIETEKLHSATLKAMAAKVEEMEQAYTKTIAALEAQVDDQADALDDAQIVKMADQPKGDPAQVEHYRLLVLTDLHKDRGMPATDHPALHDPELDEHDWPGSPSDRKALIPKIKALYTHLARHPLVYRHEVRSPQANR